MVDVMAKGTLRATMTRLLAASKNVPFPGGAKLIQSG